MAPYHCVITLLRVLCVLAVFLGAWVVFPTADQIAVADGQLDPTFGSGGVALHTFGGAYTEIEGLALQADGKIVAIGCGNSSNQCRVARFDTAGNLDTGFGTSGSRVFSSSGGSPAVSVLPNQQIAVGRSYLLSPRGFAAHRLTAAGGTDYSYGDSGMALAPNGATYVEAIQVQDDGKFLVGGCGYLDGNWNWVISRFTAEGQLDTTFGDGGSVITDFSRPEITNPIDELESLKLAPDGRIFAGGFTSTTSAMSTGNRIYAVACYDSTGALDTSFGESGKSVFSFSTTTFQQENVADIEILADGRILGADAGGSETVLFRMMPDGSLDTSFGTGGRVTESSSVDNLWAHDVEIDSRGRIVAAGSKSGKMAVARFTSQGLLDTTFATGGLFEYDGPGDTTSARALAIQPDGGILVGGETHVPNVSSSWVMVRLTTGGTANTVELGPAVDAEVDLSDGGAVIDAYGASASVQQIDFADVDRRALLEFDIRGIPEDAIITSATLDLEVIMMTGSPGSYPILHLFGYDGNGAADLWDVFDLSTPVADSDPIEDLGSMTINLDTAFLQSLLGEADYLGLAVLADANYNAAGFVTTEGALYYGADTAPTLTIAYSMQPIPGDATGDGVVDNADATVVAAHWGRSVNEGASEGDFNRDRMVDAADAAILAANWCPNSSEETTVPEPSVLVLLVGLGLGLGPLRRPRDLLFPHLPDARHPVHNPHQMNSPNRDNR